MNFRKPIVHIASFAVLLVNVLLVCQVQAQVTGGTIIGTVRDTSGATIADAKVVLQNTATGITTTVATNEYGLYRCPGLIPGAYQAMVSAADFVTLVEKNLTLEVGAELQLNPVLRAWQRRTRR